MDIYFTQEQLKQCHPMLLLPVVWRLCCSVLFRVFKGTHTGRPPCGQWDRHRTRTLAAEGLKGNRLMLTLLPSQGVPPATRPTLCWQVTCQRAGPWVLSSLCHPPRPPALGPAQGMCSHTRPAGDATPGTTHLLRAGERTLNRASAGPSSPSKSLPPAPPAPAPCHISTQGPAAKNRVLFFAGKSPRIEPSCHPPTPPPPCFLDLFLEHFPGVSVSLYVPQRPWLPWGPLQP